MRHAVVFLLAACVASLALGGAAEDPDKCPPAKCAKDFNPVCTASNNTFSNRCLAEACGGVVACQGECPCTGEPDDPSLCPPAKCTKELNFVCSTRNNTYLNPCLAESCGAEIACEGECPCEDEPSKRYAPEECDERPCPAIFLPVCATNGKTYDNQCLMEACGGELECSGECPCSQLSTEDPNADCEQRACPLNLAPICATNPKGENVTYANECLAAACNANKQCDGECPCIEDPEDRSLCPPAQCTKEYMPVCSSKGHDYPNKCAATSCGAVIACEGKCPCPASPPKQSS